MGTTLEYGGLLSGVAVPSVLLFHHGVVVGAVGGSIVGCGIVGGGSIVGRNDDSSPRSFESSKGLLEKGNGILVRAATFHVHGDIGPEVGFVGIFNILFGVEEMLFLVVERVVSQCEVRMEESED